MFRKGDRGSEFILKNFTPEKLRGRSSRPRSLPLLQVLSAFCCFSSLLSFWLPWIYSPFPLFMESCNGLLSQLFDCIESTHSEVKRKMSVRAWRNDAPKSLLSLARQKKFNTPLQAKRATTRYNEFHTSRARSPLLQRYIAFSSLLNLHALIIHL